MSTSIIEDVVLGGRLVVSDLDEFKGRDDGLGRGAQRDVTCAMLAASRKPGARLSARYGSRH